MKELYEGSFYWVFLDGGDGWQPAQFVEMKEDCNCWKGGAYFDVIGMDYAFRWGDQIRDVGDEIVRGK